MALASNWTNLPPMKRVTASAATGPLPIPEGGGKPISSQVTLNSDVTFTEFVEVKVDLTHTAFRDLGITLTAPSGAASRLAIPSATAPDGQLDLKFRLGAARHLGEDPSGVWTLEIEDEGSRGTGSFKGWEITVYGHRGEQPGNSRSLYDPLVIGTPQVGQTLTTLAHYFVDPDGMTNAELTYQWLADDAVIQGATGSTYVPVVADINKTIRVMVSYTDDAGYEEKLFSYGVWVEGVAVSLEVQDTSIAEYWDTTEFAVTFSRPLEAGEKVTVYLTYSGALRGTHYSQTWLTPSDAGVMRWTEEELRFTEGGKVANFRLKARPNTDTVDRTIAIAFGDGSSAPSATGIAGGVHILGGSSVSVDIVDDDEDVPVVSIAADGDITEGEDASFTVTASPAPSAPMWVRVRVAQTGDFLVSSGNARLFKMPTSGITQLTIRTTDDYADEADGSVTASVDLFDLHSYKISQAAKTATVAVADNDDPSAASPEVSITADGDVTEGSDASFTVSASPAPAVDLDVSVAVTQSGDFGVTTGARTVTIPTSGSYTLAIATTGDSDDEADGSVTATLNSSTGYTVSSSNGAATVAVADDDDPQENCNLPSDAITVSVVTGWREEYSAATHQSRWNRVLEALGEDTGSGESPMTAAQAVDIKSQINNDRWDRTVRTLQALEQCGNPPPATPEISIVGGSGVTEGTDATFTITASPAPQAALPVSVSVTQSGDFGATTGARSVSIPTSGSYTLIVATTNDSADEADGSVTATVDSGNGYTVSTSSGAATVAVSDDDVPEISISAGSGVTEGSNASFTITASPTPASALDVNLTVSQSGDYGATTGARTITIPTGGSYTLTIATTGDSVDEADGSVTATLNTGTGYTVSSGNGAATVAVSDDDDPLPATPEISIAAGAGVTEGGTASFIITASPTPAAALDVSVTVSQSGAYGATTGAQTVTIPTSGSYTLTIATTGDSVDEADGSVTATVNTGTGYTVSSTAGTATVAVADDDVPEICNLPSDAITVAEVTGWRDALGSNAAAGIKRWNRVLAAFGENTGQEPMTGELARQVANWLGNTRWDRTARTLEAMEQCNSPPPATPEISIAAG